MVKNCSVRGCKKKVEVRGFCGMHHRRLLRNGSPGEATPRKKPNGTFSKLVNGKIIYNKVGREYHSKEMRRLRLENPEIYKSIGYMHLARFGGMRDAVLQRDGYVCCLCGMTDKEHLKRFRRHLTVDHIDGTGRYSEEHNHKIDNLWTLCFICHGKRDALRYWLTRGKTYAPDIIETYRL